MAGMALKFAALRNLQLRVKLAAATGSEDPEEQGAAPRSIIKPRNAEAVATPVTSPAASWPSRALSRRVTFEVRSFSPGAPPTRCSTSLEYSLAFPQLHLVRADSAHVLEAHGSPHTEGGVPLEATQPAKYESLFGPDMGIALRARFTLNGNAGSPRHKKEPRAVRRFSPSAAGGRAFMPSPPPVSAGAAGGSRRAQALLFTASASAYVHVGSPPRAPALRQPSFAAPALPADAVRAESVEESMACDTAAGVEEPGAFFPASKEPHKEVDEDETEEEILNNAQEEGAAEAAQPEHEPEPEEEGRASIEVGSPEARGSLFFLTLARDDVALDKARLGLDYCAPPSSSSQRSSLCSLASPILTCLQETRAAAEAAGVAAGRQRSQKRGRQEEGGGAERVHRKLLLEDDAEAEAREEEKEEEQGAGKVEQEGGGMPAAGGLPRGRAHAPALSLHPASSRPGRTRRPPMDWSSVLGEAPARASAQKLTSQLQGERGARPTG
jgi:hypothetical protein